MLRAVNEALGDRLSPGDRNRLVKREWAEGLLAAPRLASPAHPGRLCARLLAAPTQAWVEEVGAAGYAVHGDPATWPP